MGLGVASEEACSPSQIQGTGLMFPELLGTRIRYSWVPGLEDVGLVGKQVPTTNIGLHSLWEEA